MSSSVATPTVSLEPYLRARAVNPSLIPSKPPRTARRNIQTGPTGDADFFDFLRGLLHLVVAPVIVPLRSILRTLTSPTTISLGLKLGLLGFLTLASAVFSILAVGVFWYSWGTYPAIEVEGWLRYGSKAYRTPHTLISLPTHRFQEGLGYDVQVEMELVRPPRGSEEMGNFMLSLELRSLRNPDLAIVSADQPSLPPPSLPPSILYVPPIPTSYLPPCIIPWPFRSLCPSRMLGYGGIADAKIKERRLHSMFSSPAQGKDVVLLRKELLDGVIVNPLRGGDGVIGSAFVSIGREDSFTETSATAAACSTQPREVRTTGWVVVRFLPRPTGIRWILASHPVPSLLLLPPASLSLILSSSFFAFLVITYFTRSSKRSSRSNTVKAKLSGQPMSEEALLEEKRKRVFERRDLEERREAERRRSEWEVVESSALGGFRRMPESMKRSHFGDSTIGGSETTAPTAISSFAPVPESSENGTESTMTETNTESGRTHTGEERSRRTSEASEE